MSECLTCKHWQRDSYDEIVGLCILLNELRFQHEQENRFCKYEHGEDRKPSRDRHRYVPLEKTPEQPVLYGWRVSSDQPTSICSRLNDTEKESEQ